MKLTEKNSEIQISTKDQMKLGLTGDQEIKTKIKLMLFFLYQIHTKIKINANVCRGCKGVTKGAYHILVGRVQWENTF